MRVCLILWVQRERIPQRHPKCHQQRASCGDAWRVFHWDLAQQRQERTLALLHTRSLWPTFCSVPLLLLLQLRLWSLLLFQPVKVGAIIVGQNCGSSSKRKFWHDSSCSAQKQLLACGVHNKACTSLSLSLSLSLSRSLEQLSHTSVVELGNGISLLIGIWPRRSYWRCWVSSGRERKEVAGLCGGGRRRKKNTPNPTHLSHYAFDTLIARIAHAFIEPSRTTLDLWIRIDTSLVYSLNSLLETNIHQSNQQTNKPIINTLQLLQTLLLMIS
jgi:hypothetical protein